VLIAGKGHEKVQVNKNGAIPFDDVEAARDGLNALGFDCTSVARASSAGKAI
jgi:hypothetical protein